MCSVLSRMVQKVSIAPLVNFRIIFGVLMFIATLRTILLGWVDKFYLKPKIHFKYYGFEWVEVWGGSWGIYSVYSLLLISCICIAIGFCYRFAIVLFFLLFTYTELLDVTNYLNHYYLISCVSFLLCFLPANRACAVDVYLYPEYYTDKIPIWNIYIIQLQLGIVYFFAGIAKIHPDWLFQGQPLLLWLNNAIDPVLFENFIGKRNTALCFAWAGLIFDLSVPFLLCWKKTRLYAYSFVLIFHFATAALFHIGLFPYFMIGMTLIFFPTVWHQKIITTFAKAFIFTLSKSKQEESLLKNRICIFFRNMILIVFFLLQLLIPLRHFLYPGDVLWTEEGFRFAWKVMLVDKRGYAVFTIKDRERESIVNNSDYLTEKQEFMMSYQADLILQYAHYLVEVYQQKGYEHPEVYVDGWVSYNGRISRRYIDPNVNLAAKKESFFSKEWILRYEHHQR